MVANLHGETRFADGTGALLGSFTWSVDGMLPAQASLTYRIPNVPYAVTDAPGATYRTTPAWDDVRCP